MYKIHSHGKYIMLDFNSGVRILQHRYVMEQSIGRKLNKNEVVHHVDNNGKNNNINNLQLLTVNEHAKLHALEKGSTKYSFDCSFCGKEVIRTENRLAILSKRGNKKVYCSKSCVGKSVLLKGNTLNQKRIIIGM